MKFLDFIFDALPRNKHAEYAEYGREKYEQDADPVNADKIIYAPRRDPRALFHKLHLVRGLVEMLQKGKRHKEIRNGKKKSRPSYRARISHKQEQQCAQDGKEYRPAEN